MDSNFIALFDYAQAALVSRYKAVDAYLGCGTNIYFAIGNDWDLKLGRWTGIIALRVLRCSVKLRG